MAGLQIYIDGKDEVSVVSNHFLRPMRLTRSELLALELGLAMIARERPAEDQRAIRGARERLAEVLAKLPEGVELDGHRTASISPPPDMETLRALREALRARRKVRLDYLKAGEEKPSRRTACPFAILFIRGKWYLVARCADEDVRIFRIDRIAGVRQLDETFERPPGFRVEDVVKEGPGVPGGGCRHPQAAVQPQDCPVDCGAGGEGAGGGRVTGDGASAGGYGLGGAARVAVWAGRGGAGAGGSAGEGLRAPGRNPPRIGFP